MTDFKGQALIVQCPDEAKRGAVPRSSHASTVSRLFNPDIALVVKTVRPELSRAILESVVYGGIRGGSHEHPFQSARPTNCRLGSGRHCSRVFWSLHGTSQLVWTWREERQRALPRCRHASSRPPFAPRGASTPAASSPSAPCPAPASSRHSLTPAQLFGSLERACDNPLA